jgi:hypothetical protein
MKLVKENINEFERSYNPMKAMGIGKLLQIERWLKEHEFVEGMYHINDDYTIDVDMFVGGGIMKPNISSIGLKGLPDYINFNIWKGRCFMNWNQFINMRGCPKIVTENFYINGNPLKSLKGIPKEVNGRFFIAKMCGFTEEDIMSKCKVKYEDIVLTYNPGEQKLKEIRNTDYK